MRQYIRVFLLALALGFIIYLPFLIMDSGMFVYYGDYNVQQIPFYQMCHDMIRSGEPADVCCHFCGEHYRFQTEELKELARRLEIDK